MSRIITLGATAALLVAAGCSETGVQPTVPDGNAAPEPAYVLADVARAFNVRAAGDVTARLAAGFEFHFDGHDVGTVVDGYKIPASWDRATFMAAVANLFENSTSCEMTNDWEECGRPGEGATVYHAGDLLLSFRAHIKGGGFYDVDRGPCDYDFIRGSSGEWSLGDWFDRTYGCGCSLDTFGRILVRNRA